MRILIELNSIRDQSIEIMQYHKLQGFIYSNLINQSQFKGIHDLKTYKYYCYSNIFPPSPAKVGERRFLIFSTPNQDLIDSVYDNIRELIANRTITNIGNQSYLITCAKMLKTIPNGNKCYVKTSTPITVRLSEKGYSKYHIPINLQKKKFIYWRSSLSSSILLKLLEENIKKKYESFYEAKLSSDLSIIDEFELLKELVIHLPVAESTIKIPSSFWNFGFDTSNKEKQSIFTFILDCGLGERNSYGFGFINMIHGSKLQIVKKIT